MMIANSYNNVFNGEFFCWQVATLEAKSHTLKVPLAVNAHTKQPVRMDCVVSKQCYCLAIVNSVVLVDQCTQSNTALRNGGAAPTIFMNN